MKWTPIAGFILVACVVSSALPTQKSQDLRLWYNQPAVRWDQALPIGNGRLGAMVFGDTDSERIQLNEISIWAGPPFPQPKTNGPAVLARARELYFKGEFAQGESLIQREMLPAPFEPRSYQPLGDLVLKFTYPGQVTNSYRELNLDTAVATSTCDAEGTRFTREVYASREHDVVVCHVSSSVAGKLSFTIDLTRPDAEVVALDDKTLRICGQASHGDKNRGVKFTALLEVRVNGGQSRSEGSTLAVRGASSATLVLAASTDYNIRNPFEPLRIDREKACRAMLKKSSAKHERLRAASAAAHQRLFRRVALDLNTPAPDLPTNERLDLAKKGNRDIQLESVYFQFGRYLLISSSRAGQLPANLQGLWNEHMRAPWNADYHININIQMNYWQAEVANLSEVHEPFFQFMENLVPAGQETAKQVFGCRGFCACLTSDAWYWTTVYGSPQWGMWVMGGAWGTQHFMEHYRFTGDREFLRKRAYPILKESSLFFLDWLVSDPKTDKLVSGPSTSPENNFIGPDGKRTSLSMGCSMDQQIIWDVFSNTLEAARVLGIENAFTAEVRNALRRLAMPGIGQDGRLMEWTQEYQEPEPGHRHVSHLFGIHPGRQYTMSENPDYVTAARKSIERRLANGGGHTGWSRAWIINFWARFRDGNKAHENLQALIAKSTLPNMFDTHPPFQIDGNFGGTAGIAEMLLQSHERGANGAYIVHLLPALPDDWKTGSIKGLKARGGFEVDIAWKDGVLREAVIRSSLGQPAQVLYAGKAMQMQVRRGKSYLFEPER